MVCPKALSPTKPRSSGKKPKLCQILPANEEKPVVSELPNAILEYEKKKKNAGEELKITDLREARANKQKEAEILVNFCTIKIVS